MNQPTLDSARKYYQGGKATGYEGKRSSRAKWTLEYECLRGLLRSVSGTLIDVPVGTGRFLPLYRELGLKAAGVDYSEEMLLTARAKHPNDILWQGDVTSLPCSDGQFDAAVCIRLLHLVAPAEVAPVMAELFRVASRHVIVTIPLDQTEYVRGRSQVHVRKTIMSCVKHPWALSASLLIMKEKGVPNYMLHFVR